MRPQYRNVLYKELQLQISRSANICLSTSSVDWTKCASSLPLPALILTQQTPAKSKNEKALVEHSATTVVLSLTDKELEKNINLSADMAETQKGNSSPVNSKERDSLPDLDFGKDFLSSWKSMSMAEDPMDLDFGPASKGKKKAFRFDKVDMDFNIDGDFGKLPSFNMDLPDLAISSPLKKDAKTHDRSEKESASGNNNGKADHFAFSFDFNDLDGFNFKSSPRKEEIKAKEDEEKENSSNKTKFQNSENHPTEEIGDKCLHEDVISRMATTEALITPNLGTQVDAGSDLPVPENFSSKSTPIENDLLNSEVRVDDFESNQVVKTIFINMQQSDCMPDKSISPEPVSKKPSVEIDTIKDTSVHSTSRDDSSRDTVSELQDEVSSRVTKHIASSVKESGGSQFWTGEGTEHALGESISNKKGNSKSQNLLEVSTNPVSGFEGSKCALAESIPNKTSNLMNQNPLEVSTKSLRSDLDQTMPLPIERSIATTSVAEKQREAFTTRSKYFKRPDKTEDVLSNASNQTKLFSLRDKVTSSRLPHPVEASSKSNMKEIQSDGKLNDISLPNSGAPVGKEHLKIGIQDDNKDITLNRPLDQETLKGKSVSGGGSKNVKILDSVRTRQTDKFTSQNSVNSANLVPNMQLSHTINKIAPEGYKSYASDAMRHLPALCSQKTSRTSGGNLDLCRSLKDLDQNIVGSRQSETAQIVETKKQTLLSPSLKRKAIEIPNADALLKPSKRLSDPITNRHSAEISKHVVDKEGCNNENVVDGNRRSILEDSHNSELYIPWEMNMKELEVRFSLENDTNIENAEACTKELEDICNMLRNKHDEAKEILVRAVVNNNKLLMLNHPLYEEKIRMVQKFALQLTLREVDTQT